jgi:ACS family allantoate permease-like MFS transporter
MQRLPLAKYTATNIIIWGCILSCMAATTNWAGVMVVRTFLGIFEASVTPGFALFTSQWYRKHEQGARTGLWFSFNGFAQIVGGLVAYGIATGTNSGQAALAGWRIMFLWTGLTTAVFGVLLFIFMPDNPLNARFLSPKEKVYAIERIRVNQQGVGNRHFKKYQFIEALKDPLVWAFLKRNTDSRHGAISSMLSSLISPTEGLPTSSRFLSRDSDIPPSSHCCMGPLAGQLKW